MTLSCELYVAVLGASNYTYAESRGIESSGGGSVVR
jgi:hypothetical protein